MLATACGDKPLILKKPITPPSRSASLRDLPRPPQSETAKAAEKPPGIPQEAAGSITLADVVNIALANSTQTKATWLAARAAAAEVGIRRAEYLPTIDLDGEFAHTKQSAMAGQFSYDESDLGATGTLQVLLFDFGGRSARLKEAWAALLAADFSHNAGIQSVILQVQTAYFGYLNVKAQLTAAQSTVKETKVSLDAALTRREIGVATTADVLQAQTAYSQAKLVEQTLAGRIRVSQGRLATAMGLPADTPFEIGELPVEVPKLEIAHDVESLIEEAVQGRPDLVSVRWQAEEAVEHLKGVQAEWFPSFSGSAMANVTDYLPKIFDEGDNNWSAGLMFHYPLFTGFSRTNKVKKARAEAESRANEITRISQQVILDVWTACAELTTAAQQVKTSRDLLASAEESESVALARYKEGAGSILDLLTAQRALSAARAEEIQSRSNWFVAVSRLAYATGGLSVHGLLKPEKQTSSPPEIQ